MRAGTETATGLLKSVTANLGGRRELPVTRIVDGLMENKAGGEAEDFAYYDPNVHDDSGARPREARKPVREAVVFVVGGGSYVEHGDLQEYARRANRRVTSPARPSDGTVPRASLSWDGVIRRREAACLRGAVLPAHGAGDAPASVSGGGPGPRVGEWDAAAAPGVPATVCAPPLSGQTEGRRASSVRTDRGKAVDRRAAKTRAREPTGRQERRCWHARRAARLA